MSQQRSISRVVNVPPAVPGFVGPGHLAAPVVSPENFEMTDPFILLMDDHLDIGNRPVGGPHPHAGFETVTLILDARRPSRPTAQPPIPRAYPKIASHLDGLRQKRALLVPDFISVKTWTYTEIAPPNLS